MADDWDSNSIFGDPDDAAVFYGVPNDHPAFRGPEENADDGGYGEGEPGIPGDSNEAGHNVLQLPVGRYDGYSDKDRQESGGVPGASDPRQRTADEQFLQRKLEQRARDRGTRSIREHAVASSNSGSTSAGESSTGESGQSSSLHAQLAASLEQAGINLREEWKRPESVRGDQSVVEEFVAVSETAKEHGAPNKITVSLPLTGSRAVGRAPDFQRASLRGQLSGLKSNSSGSWVLTLVIDPDCVSEVTKLGGAHGLALDILVTRKSR